MNSFKCKKKHVSKRSHSFVFITKVQRRKDTSPNNPKASGRALTLEINCPS